MPSVAAYSGVSVCLVLYSVLVECGIQWVHSLWLWWWGGQHSASCGSVWAIWPTCTALIQSWSFPGRPCLSFPKGMLHYGHNSIHKEDQQARLRGEEDEGFTFSFWTQKNIWLMLSFRRKFSLSGLWDLLAFSLFFPL